MMLHITNKLNKSDFGMLQAHLKINQAKFSHDIFFVFFLFYTYDYFDKLCLFMCRTLYFTDLIFLN